MNRRIILLLLLMPATGLGQSVTGKVQGSDGKVLPSVNVLLLTAKDSALVLGSISDAGGGFRIDNAPAGSYRISVSGIGYIQTFSAIFSISSADRLIQIPLLTLVTQSRQLAEVTVTAKRPLIEQKIDRTIVNVANSIIASGATALEVLEKAPGVMIDRQNDQISLRGKDGVIVQIDGKQTYMPMADVVALLKNMPSDNIDRIELITNPSAKYDAAGNAGIIDIRLKKNNNIGTNGSASATIGSGRYMKKRSGFQINHRTSGINLFGNYSAYRDEGYWDFDIKRKQVDGSKQNLINSLSYIRFKNYGQNVKAGLDYFVTRRTTMGIVWTASWNNVSELSPAHALFQKDEASPIYLHTLSDKTISNKTSNHLANINIQHSFSNAAQITADFDVAVFGRRYLNSLNTRQILPSTPTEPISGLSTRMPTTIDIITFKTDYTRNINSKWKMEAGLKSSSVRSDNDVELKTGTNGTYLKDTALSNHFEYIEDVHAGYVNMAGKLNEKNSLTIGVRAEYTHSVGKSLTVGTAVERNYINLFPSLFLMRRFNLKNTLAFSYSYRIDRPNYQSLNPARSYLDPYTYSAGNAYLKPQFTHSFELRHGFKEKVFTSVSASLINDLQFFLVQGVDDKVSRRMPENIGQSKAYSLTTTFPSKIINGWSLQTTLTGTYSSFHYHYKGSPIKAQQIAGTVNVINTIIFGKGWTGECSGWLRSPAVAALQKTPWLGSLDAGVQKAFGSRWKAKMSFQDLLHTNKILFDITAPGFSSTGKIEMDTRVASLNITYNFGNQRLKNSRQRKTAAEEEVQRTN